MAIFEQIVSGVGLYLNGLILSNDSVTPNTKLDVSAGICRDSLNQFDINLGNYLGVDATKPANVATVINFGVNGANGLDTGVLLASKMYYIYVIADPQGFKHPACIASLNVPSVGPLMPEGYGLVRWIGCWNTDVSVHLYAGYVSGNNNEKYFYYANETNTPITAGHDTTYAPCNLINLVPALNNTVVDLLLLMNAQAAGNVINLQPINAPISNADIISVVAPVVGSTALTSEYVSLLSQVQSSTVIGVNFHVANASDSLNIKICGYEMSL